MKMKVGFRTDVGQVREGNEDSYLVEDPLFGVADGMGGHAAGEVASGIAVEVLTRDAAKADGSDPNSLAQMVRDANNAIIDRAESDDSLEGMGTTCTIVLVDGTKLHLAHVGDSRAYRFRGGELTRLSEDHTLVGRMVKDGRLTEDEAARHPQRSVVTRVLGVEKDVQVDLESFEIEPGDRYLICSDGLTGMISESAISEVLSYGSEAQHAADRLVDMANEAGGEDNITVVILDTGSDDNQGGEAPPVPAAVATTQAPDEASPPPPPPSTPIEKATGRSTKAPLGAPPSETPDDDRRSSRGFLRRSLVALVILAIIAGAGYGAIRYSLNNSWFVGVGDSDHVTIFQGRPEEVLGFSLKEVEEETDILIDDVPAFKRQDVIDGIKTDSLEEARAAVANIEDLVQSSSTPGDKKKDGQ